MATFGSINNNVLVGGVPIGQINSQTVVQGSALGTKSSLATVSIDMQYYLNMCGFGGGGTVTETGGWYNMNGEPYVDGSLLTDVDFGQIGSTGIGLRCINNAATDTAGVQCWGELGNSALGNFGESTGPYGTNANVYYWFVQNRRGVIELYNHTGTPLNGKTFIIRCYGSRSNSGGATGPRTTNYRVNGGSIVSVNSFQNTSNKAEFTGIQAVAGVITIEVEDAVQWGYLNVLEIEQAA